MDLITFIPTRFGKWTVKLSYAQQYDQFVVVAYDNPDRPSIVRSFDSEIEVVKFVTFLGDQHE